MQMSATQPTTAPMMAGVLSGGCGSGEGLVDGAVEGAELRLRLFAASAVLAWEAEVVVEEGVEVEVWVVEVLEVVGWEVVVREVSCGEGSGAGGGDEVEGLEVVV